MPTTRIADFDTWRPGYGGSTVSVFLAGSSVLADIFTDEALTVPAINPQVLISRVEAGITYGKFSAPVYIDQAFELKIDNIDSTGIIRPALTSTEAEDISQAVATPDGAVVAHTIADHLARTVWVQDFGEFLETGETGASSATNNQTLVTAIGAAGAQGGGIVQVPPGTYDFIDLVIPEGVVVSGAGEGATFLQSTYAGPVVILAGPRSGFAHLTLDGQSQEGNSVGIFAVALDESVFSEVTIKRFETGVYFRGGERNSWTGLTVSDCVNGAKLHGDLNAGAGGGGEAFQTNRWVSGTVEFCSDVGIEFKRIDSVCAFNLLDSVSFRENVGPALRINGARSTRLVNPSFIDNIENLVIEDGTPFEEDKAVVGFEVVGGRFAEGTITLKDTLQDVIFDAVEFSDVDITITAPTHNILALDCREDSAVNISGAATHWLRRTTTDNGAAFGLTAGNAPTKAWAITLDSGQRVLLEAKVIGRGRNTNNVGFYWFGNSASRALAALAYDTQTGNFTVGNIVTGGTSGATARIVVDTDGGTTGTLSVQDIVGVFVDNEVITDGAGGSAIVNGGVTEGATSVGTPVAIRTAQETDAAWNAEFVANGPEIELRVTGATGQTVEWNVDVAVTST